MRENLFDRFSKDYDDSYQRAPGRIKSCSTRKQEIPMDWQRILLVEGIGEQDKIKDFFFGFFTIGHLNKRTARFVAEGKQF